MIKINLLNRLFNLDELKKEIDIKHEQNKFALIAEKKYEKIEFENDSFYFFWNNGIWEYGIWGYGYWVNGTWNNGLWKNGYWHDGIWNNGTWEKGAWRNGIWEGGYILDKETNKYKYSELPPNKVEWSYSYQI
jgi:hypothetical protein